MSITQEQIIVEFIGDTQQLEPAVDILAKIGVVDKDVAAQFKKANTDYSTRIKLLKEMSSGQEKAAAAQKSSVKTTGDLSKALSGLVSNVKDGAVHEILKGAFEGMNDALVEAGVTLDEFSNKFGQSQNEVSQSGEKGRKSVFKLRTEYHGLLADASAAGGAQTEAGRKILEQAGKIYNEINNVTAASKAFGSDTALFDGVLQGLSSIAAGYQVAVGAAQLLGSEDEDLQKALVELQAIMAVTNGVQQIQVALQKESAFTLSVLNPLQRIWNNYLGQSTGLLRGLKVALAATGIGIFVIAISELVTNWEKYKAVLTGVSKTQGELNKLRTESAKSAAEEKTQASLLVEEYSRVNTSQERRKAIIGELQDISPAYFGTLSKEKTSIDDLTVAYTKYAKAVELKATVDVAAKKIAENNIRLAEIEIGKDLEDQVDIFETIGNTILSFGDNTDFALRQVGTAIKNSKKEIGEITNFNKVLTNEIIKAQQSLDSIGGDPGKKKEKVEKGKSKAEILKEEYENAAKSIEKTASDIRLSISSVEFSDGDKKVFDLQIDIAELQEKLRAAKKFGQDISSLQNDLAGKTIALREANDAAAKQSAKELADEIERKFNSANLALDKSFQNQRENIYDNAKTKEELDKALTGLEQIELQKRKELYTQYGKDTFDIDNQIFEFKRRAREKDLEDQTVYQALLQDLGYNSLQQTSDFLFSLSRDQFAAQEESLLKDLDKRKQAELSNKRLTEEQKQKIDDRYQKEQSKIKNDAAKKQRQADILQASINGLLGITRVLAEVGDPIRRAIAIAQTVITTGLQIAAISAKPLPQFSKGVEYVKGPGTATSDSILARLSRGERVLTARENRDYSPALNIIHKRKLPPSVVNKLLTDPMAGYNGTSKLKVVEKNSSNKINEDRLASKIASGMLAGMEENNRYAKYNKRAAELLEDLVNSQKSNRSRDLRRA